MLKGLAELGMSPKFGIVDGYNVVGRTEHQMVGSATFRRGFSVSDANATLPLVRAIVADMVELSKDIESREARVGRLLKQRGEDRSDPYEDELREIRRSLDEDRQQLGKYAIELEHVGVRVRSATLGLMEFPSWLGEKEVALIWSPAQSFVVSWSNLGDTRLKAIGDLEFTAEPVSPERFHPGRGSR